MSAKPIPGPGKIINWPREAQNCQNGCFLSNYSLWKLETKLNSIFPVREVRNSPRPRALPLSSGVFRVCGARRIKSDLEESKWKKSYSRKNESISVGPFRILWVVVQDLVKQDVSNRCHTPRNVGSVSNLPFTPTTDCFYSHRGTGMARVRLEGGIDLQR